MIKKNKRKTCTKCGEEKPATLEYFYKRDNRLRADCKVCYAEGRKTYYEANKEAILGQQKVYFEANKEVALGRKRAYYRTPKGRFAHIKKEAKIRCINFSLPFELYETQLWGNPCHYCGCEIEVTGLDRKDSDKGYTPDNVVPCCADCNIKKGIKPYEQFIQEQKESRGS